MLDIFSKKYPLNCVLLPVFLLVFYFSDASAVETQIEAPSSCSFSGDFEQSKSLKGLDIALKSSGVFFFDCKLGVIWKTLMPVEETLVLNKSGQGSRVEQSHATPIKSRQGRLLGKLINGLMGADSKFIDDNFEVQSSIISVASAEPQQYLQRQSHALNPKKGRLRRAIKRIELVTPLVNQSLQNNESDDNQVNISLLDRNNQWTHIISRKNANYSSTEGELGQCNASEIFDELECELLEQSQAN